ncbi:MAG TPA: di-heme oxidoredictase family protein [Bacteroidia bacterium]
MKKVLFTVSCLLLLIAGCKKIMPKAPAEDEVLDGPVEGLTAAEKDRFLKGDLAFNDDIFTPQNGLGPIFVANSCGSCHAGDGKGHPFTTLTRFGQTDSTGNLFLSLGAPQLQNRAIPGYTPEQIPTGATSTKILPPANTGLGFLDAVSDADLIALSDPYDTNGDGISGVANWIHPPAYCINRPNTLEQNGKYIARFGKKGAAYDLLQQTANAYNQDMGVNSSYEVYDTWSKLEVDPEVSNETVNNVVFYLKTLKAPVQRNQGDADVQSGKQVFMSIGCNKCHTPELKTGSSPVAALAYKTFYPYTDMLLHDMGPGLDDHYTEGSAKSYEWKTPPLWGLGLSKDSQGGIYYLLHDGRAHSIDEAIQLHGGEADQVKTLYQHLPAAEKEKLLKFLESL